MIALKDGVRRLRRRPIWKTGRDRSGLRVALLLIPQPWLAGLCLPDALDFWRSAARHWTLMPWMHAGMLLVTLVALCAALRRRGYGRAAFDLACGIAMLGSMDAVAWAAGHMSRGVADGWAVGAAMPLAWAAMVWSVVLLVLLRQAAPALAILWRPGRRWPETGLLGRPLLGR